MRLRKVLGKFKRYIRTSSAIKKRSKTHLRRFEQYAFNEYDCKDENQYEAVITRWYHTIEKGLSYENYRPGFGAHNIAALLNVMEQYIADGYSEDKFFYQTALSALKAYIAKNEQYGCINLELKQQVEALPGDANECGGVVEFTPMTLGEIQQAGYDRFITARHSLRHFSDSPVDLSLVIDALKLAQHTPSACNRQGWSARIISETDVLEKVLANQNGSEGFKQEINKLLLITGDIRAFNRDRELHQMYIDGGMYAQSILNALHFYGLATIPLSAALNPKQEVQVRNILDVSEAEVFIMFIGVGHYPEKCVTARSERHEIRMKIY